MSSMTGRRVHAAAFGLAVQNFASKSVFDALGSVMSNKYSEGYPGARFVPASGPPSLLHNSLHYCSTHVKCPGRGLCRTCLTTCANSSGWPRNNLLSPLSRTEASV